MVSGLASSVNIESIAVRKAKAAFTLPATTPPWKAESSSSSASLRLSQILTAKSLVSPVSTGSALDAQPADVATAFTAWKALDKFQTLAEAAVKSGSDTTRAKLDAVFQQGLKDLGSYLSTSPSENLDLAFGLPTRRAESVVLPKATENATIGTGVLAQRDTPIESLTGTETFSITLRKYNLTDTVSVDLSKGPQPPTLDSISDQVNEAITSVTLRNPDGSVYLDNDGNSVPRYLVRFAPNKDTDKWGFKVENPGLEQVSIREDGAGDSLLVLTGRAASDSSVAFETGRITDVAGELNRTVAGTALSYSPLATLSDDDGSVYVVGKASGTVDGNVAAGSNDLILTKLDNSGKPVFQKVLGAAGEAEGAAITRDAEGNLVVAASISGTFDGSNLDGDLAVLKFSDEGEELSNRVIRRIGVDKAQAIAVGTDGSIHIAGSSSDGANGLIVSLDSSGNIARSNVLDSGARDQVVALQAGENGSFYALTREGSNSLVRSFDASGAETGSIDLGASTASALAKDSAGNLFVAGTEIGGDGSNDGFVAKLSADLSSLSRTNIGTSATDKIDSLIVSDDGVFLGGRTSGTLGEARIGTTDGFVARLDAADLSVESIRQFGRPGGTTQSVLLARSSGGDNVLNSLGLNSGELLAPRPTKLTDRTSLRVGDEFSIQVGGKTTKFAITADDTLTTLANRIQKAIGDKGTASAASVDGGQALRIDAKTGQDISLIAGAEGKDALAKLGLTARKLSAAPLVDDSLPTVRPGGSYGLNLATGLSLSSKESATAALTTIKNALSMTQTAYRSLYWDDNKAAKIDGAISGSVSAYQSAQLARYQDALSRVSAISANWGA